MGGRYLKDIAGKRFGLLTAVRPTEQRAHRTVVWECACDCGNTAYVTLGNLRNGSTKSCGCLKHQTKSKKQTGIPTEVQESMRFTRLTVIRPAQGQETNTGVWECLCDCGKTVFAKAEDLLREKIESCGCLERAQAAKQCMERHKDMVGKRFGRLTAIRATGEVKRDSMVWECLCDCGNTAFVVQQSLKSGGTKSCGCLQKEKSRKGVADLSLIGQRFGKLVALNQTEEARKKSMVWECLCDCGNKIQITRRELLSGSVTSCGCQKDKPVVRYGRDLTGCRFDKLTIIRPTEERRNRSVVWECKCDCGNTVKLSRVQMKRMKHLSCGCDEEQKPVLKGEAIEGQRFGRLVAVRPTEALRDKSIVWECQCDCGNTVLESQAALTRGQILSCGCIQKEQIQKRLDALTNENAGKRFGRLTILYAVTEAESKRIRYVCRCDCGKEIHAQLSDLQRGMVKSCGCLIKEFGQQKSHDLTGQQFGYLTAIRKTDERRGRAVVWECRCVCGKTTYVAANSLRSGNTKSCGCKGKSQVNTEK